MLLVSFHWNTPQELESKSRASPIVERKCEYLKIVQVEKSTKLTEEQWLDMWGKRMQDFFGRPGDKTKARKGYQEPERLATLSWMQDMRNALSGIGWSFGDFAFPPGPSHTLDKQDGTRPPMLILCTDQEATQLAAVSYLKYQHGLWLEHVMDPAHRSHNDVQLALSAAGMMKFSLWCISLYNIRYGPWQKAAWSSKIKETADILAGNMSPSDPLLLEFFPSILEDAGRPLTDNTEAERQKFLKSLPDKDCVRTKGTKASKSRFNSLSISHSELDTEWSALAFLLCAVCISSGWSTKPSDLWAPDHPCATAATRSDKPGTSKGKATADAKKDTQDAGRGSANTLHRMTRFICSSDNKNMARLIFNVLQPEALRCSKMLKDLRSPDMTLQFYSQWAHWSWMDTARDHVLRLQNLAALQRIGFNMYVGQTPPVEAEIAWQDSLAGQMYSLLKQILRHRAGSQLFYTNGFGATAGLVHEDNECKTRSLSFFQAMWDTVQITKKSGTLLAKTLIEGHCSTGPIMQYILKTLSGSNFRAVPDILAKELKCIWSGLLNSKLIEDGNKIQREAEQRNSNSKELGRMAGWFGLTSKKLLGSYSRAEVHPEGLYHVPNEWKKENLFCRPKVRGGQQSDKEKREDKLLEDVTKSRTWPSHNHQTEQEVLSDFSLVSRVVSHKWDWGRLETGWHAALLPEGHAVLLHGQPVLVIKSYRRGALCWPGHFVSSPGVPDILELDQESSLCWVHIFNAEVTTVELNAVSPARFSVYDSMHAF